MFGKTQIENFVHAIGGAWSDMRKTISAVCTLGQEKGVSSYATSYKCVCLLEWAPWSSTGLYTYRKNPSVDTLFGQEHHKTM